jgi:hypothetical protein
MLDNLSVAIETKDVHARVVIVPWPGLMAMQYDQITFSDCALEVDSFAREFRRHPLKESDEGLFAIGYFGIVLNVNITHVLLNGFTGSALIEHQVIECLRVHLVLFQFIAHTLNSCLCHRG